MAGEDGVLAPEAVTLVALEIFLQAFWFATSAMTAGFFSLILPYASYSVWLLYFFLYRCQMNHGTVATVWVGSILLERLFIFFEVSTKIICCYLCLVIWILLLQA